MTTTGASPRRRRLWKYLIYFTLLSMLSFVGLAWWITSPGFQAMVRQRLVTELERVTGGRVELKSIHVSPFRLRVEVRDLTIHGREAAEDIPYAHVDRLVAEVKIISALGAEFGFHSVVLDHPVVHLIFYPDGSTNQPTPKRRQSQGKSPLQQLFALSISRLEVRHGECLWNDQRYPLDFTVNDVSADMNYSLLRRRYETNLLLGKIVTRIADYRPFAWMTEAHFSFGADSIEVHSLRANSGRSHIEASGRIHDFRQPHLEGIYKATIDLEEAGAVARRPELRGGQIQAEGHGSWSAAEFFSAGKLLARDLEWRDKSLNLNKVSFNGDFSASPQRLSLARVQARLCGGSATADAEVTGWSNVPAVPDTAKERKGKAKSAASRETTVEKGLAILRLKDVSTGALAAAISSPEYPLHRMNLTGTTSGNIEVRWTGSLRAAETQLALDFAAPSSPPASQLPLNGRIRSVYHARTAELELAELDAATRTSQIHASGRLAPGEALKLSVSSFDLAEWPQILAAIGRPMRIPVTLHGRGSFNGTAAGKLSDLAIAGNLRAEDFDYQASASSYTPAQTFHWDLLTAGIDISAHQVIARNAIVRHANTVINFDLTASLDHGQFTDSSPFDAHVEVHQEQIAELAAFAGYDRPVSGIADFRLDLSGTPAQPGGNGHVEISDANFYGETFQHLDSDLSASAGQLRFSNLHATYHGAPITATASYDLATHASQFDLKATNVGLTYLPGLRSGRVPLDGQMDLSAQGSGSVEAPVVNATLRLHDLVLDQEPISDFTLTAKTHGADLQLSGRSQSAQPQLTLDGTIHLRGDWPASIQARFDQLDVGAVLRRSYLQGHLTGPSPSAGELQLQGPLRRPRNLDLAGNLSELHFGVENVKLHNDGPIRFSISDQTFHLEPLHLLGDNTDLSGEGTVELVGRRQLDLRAQGKINLKLIESLNSDFTSSGVVAIDLQASGTLDQPVTQGRVQITNGALAENELPTGLSDINGTAIFNQNRLQIQDLTAHSGGGLVTFTGTASWYGGQQLNFDLNLKEQDVRLRYPPGISSTANTDLRLVGNLASSTLSGNVTVTKLSLMPGFDFGAYLARSSRTAALPPTNTRLNGIRLDVHIVSTPELQMQTAAVRLSGDADLRLRGTAAKPVVVGRADVLEGEVFFNGTKYQLERGSVIFTNPVTTTPVLDLQATTTVRDYDITLILNGEPDKQVRVNYRSEPPLPEADIINLLALGHTTEESAQLQQSGNGLFTQEASTAVIGQALNAAVSNRVQRLFGGSRIKIDPEGIVNETTTLSRGPAVTIEQEVQHNLTLTYTQDVTQTSEQIIQAEYNMSHNISIVGLRDQNGVVSFDIRLRRRRK